MAKKRSREVLEQEKRDFELTELTLGEPKWRRINKKLTDSDLNDLCRLILPAKQVENYVLPFIYSEENRKMVDTSKGLRVKIVDERYGSIHYLSFKKWPSSKSYVLVSNWKQEFVVRLRLTEDNWIQIYWSKYTQCFFFSVVLPPQPQQPPQPQPQPHHWLRLTNDVDDGLQLAVMIQDQHQKQQQQQQCPLRARPLQCIPLKEVNTDDRLHQLHPPPQLRPPQFTPLMEVGTTDDSHRLQQLHHPPQFLPLMGGIADERLPLMNAVDNERLQRRHHPNKKQKSTAPCLFPNWVDDTTNDHGLNLKLTH